MCPEFAAPARRSVSRFTFRTRVLLYLVLFAVIPSTVLMVGGAIAVSRTLPVLSASKAWDNVANSGRRAIEAARAAPLTSSERAAVDAHERELAASLVQAKRVGYLTSDRKSTRLNSSHTSTS